MPQLPSEITEIMKRAENKFCADCQARDPKWASVTIGILICENCAGIHRKLGTHLTTVKSTSLDKWKPDWVATVKAIGNAKAAAFYESDVPESERYVGTSTVSQGDKLDVEEGRKLEKWIRDKYELMKFAPPGAEEPRKRLARGESLEESTPTGGEKKEKKEKKHHKHSRRKSSDDAASPDTGVSEAFAALGQWAAEPEDKAKAHKKKKKEKRESSRKRHSDTEQMPQDEQYPQQGLDEGLSPAAGWDAAWGGGGPAGLPQGQEACYPGYEQHMMMPPQQGYEGYGAPPAAYDTGQAPAPCAGSLPLGQQDLSAERRRALLSIARLYQAPEVMGLAPGMGASMLPLHGFDLQAAEFRPEALRWPKDGLNASAVGKAFQPPVQAQVQPATFAQPAAPAVGQELQQQWLPVPEQQLQQPGSAEVSQLTDELKKLRTEMQHLRNDCKEIKEETLGTAAAISALRKEEGEKAQKAMQEEEEEEDWWNREVATTPTGCAATVPVSPALAGTAPVSPMLAGTAPVSPCPAGRALPVSPVLGWQQTAAGAGPQPVGSWQMGSMASGLVHPAPAATPDISTLAYGSQPLSTGPCGYGGGGCGMPNLAEDVGTGPLQQQPEVNICFMDRDAFANYAHHFRQLDTNQDNVVEGRDVRPLFDQSSLDAPELKLIWTLCDTGHRGRMTLEEFACAMHLVCCRRQGSELPAALPMALVNTVRHLAAEYRATATPPPPPEHLAQPADPTAAQQEAHNADSAAAPEELGADTGPTLSWEVSPEELERYRATYDSLDPDVLGTVGPMEVKELLERTNLPTAELSQIWQLSDVDLDSRLSPGELVCAMHLAARRMQGLPLPDALPPELAAFVGIPVHGESPAVLGEEGVMGTGEVPLSTGEQGPRFPSRGPGLRAEETAARSAVDWDQENLSEEEVAGLWHLADADATGRLAHNDFIYAALLLTCKRRSLELSGEVGREEALMVLEQSDLPQAELSRIWRLADADADGLLNFSNFTLAMQLVGRRLHGLDLPPSPEPEPAEQLTSPGVVDDETESPWAITPDRVRRYRSLFERLPRQDRSIARQDEVRDTLERSGLSAADLARCWELADVDGDGMLTFVEFACVLHLVAGRRQGLELPDELPQELAHLAQLLDAVGGAEPAGPPAATTSSPWVILRDQLESYRELFLGLERTEVGTLGPQEAVEFVSRSQLPQDELMHALRLSDMNGDGQLSFGEFACAMHLVTLRCQGLEIPPELPAAMVGSLEDLGVL